MGDIGKVKVIKKMFKNEMNCYEQIKYQMKKKNLDLSPQLLVLTPKSKPPPKCSLLTLFS